MSDEMLDPTKVLISKLAATGMLRAALTYQGERLKLFFWEQAYKPDGKLVQQLCDIWDDFKLLTRNPQVVVIDHFDSMSTWRDSDQWGAVEKLYIVDQSLTKKPINERPTPPEPGTSSYEYNQKYNPLANTNIYRLDGEVWYEYGIKQPDPENVIENE